MINLRKSLRPTAPARQMINERASTVIVRPRQFVPLIRIDVPLPEVIMVFATLGRI